MSRQMQSRNVFWDLAAACALAVACAAVLAAPARGQVLGDANCDGIVDVADLPLLYAALFGATPCDAAPFNADTNGDGRLSAADLPARAGLGNGQSHTFEPPFALQSDPSPDPNQRDYGLARDAGGNLILQPDLTVDALWVANTQDWDRGSVSKIDTSGVKELARYFSTTCLSNAGGSRNPCDGTTGCCARDDYARFQHRQAHQPEGPHQAVQTSDGSPTTVAVDHNGDVWVMNRAFVGQPSVTKIAFDPRDCAERNGRAGIQTSSDANDDGVIDTDCDRNGVPDDLNTTCTGGRVKEFYGDDDECVLFTTNVGEPQRVGRGLTLTPTGNPSDAWASTYNDGRLFRIDGASGVIATQVSLPPPVDAMTADRSGILWVQSGQSLRYFDFRTPGTVGLVRVPTGFTLGLGFGDSSISLDPDQNIWVSALMNASMTPSVFRYTPNRSSFASLAAGFWTRVTNPGTNAGASGLPNKVVVDARTSDSYFAWVARDGRWIARVDASAIALPNGSDTTVDASASPAIRVGGSMTLGAAVDSAQNVWGISANGSTLTRLEIDATGAVAPGPDSLSLIIDDVATMPNPWGNGDLTGFALQHFTAASGAYSVVFRGCAGGNATWLSASWDADTPPQTGLTVRARSGPTATPDASWGDWTGSYDGSADFMRAPGPLEPNPAPFIQVEISLSSADPDQALPTLTAFGIGFRCN